MRPFTLPMPQGSSSLYVGAGTDFPLAHLPTERLVCVDGQPFSEFGTARCLCHPEGVRHCFSRRHFLGDLDREARRAGLPPPRVDGDARRYGEKVLYLTNTALPDHALRVAEEGPFSCLVAKGHHPHRSALDLLLPSGNVFVGFHGTVYSKAAADEQGEDTVVSALHSSRSTRDRFLVFTLVLPDGRLHCEEWADFLRLWRDRA